MCSACPIVHASDIISMGLLSEYHVYSNRSPCSCTVTKLTSLASAMSQNVPESAAIERTKEVHVKGLLASDADIHELVALVAAFPRSAEVLAGVLQAFGTMALHGGVLVSEQLCDAGVVEMASMAISTHPDEACRVLMWLAHFLQAQVTQVTAWVPLDVLEIMRTVRASKSVTDCLNVLVHEKVCSVNTDDCLIRSCYLHNISLKEIKVSVSNPLAVI